MAGPWGTAGDTGSGTSAPLTALELYGTLCLSSGDEEENATLKDLNTFQTSTDLKFIE